MRGSDALDAAVTRLARDLDLAPWPMRLTIDRGNDGLLLTLTTADDLASCSAPIDDDGPVGAEELEGLVVDIAQALDDALWPDDLTEPWPACPKHRDHPLMPRVLAGRASWLCDRDSHGVIGIPIGQLAEHR